MGKRPRFLQPTLADIVKFARRVVEFLPNVNLEKKKFGDIFTVDQIDSMAQLLQQEYFRKGDIILREGEAGKGGAQRAVGAATGRPTRILPS